MRWILAALIFMPNSLAAEPWEPMTGAQILEILADQTVYYKAAHQNFYTDGRTLYDAGSESWGTWLVRGNQYCSQWPPSDRWDCYDMASNGQIIRFVAEGGTITDGFLHAE